MLQQMDGPASVRIGSTNSTELSYNKDKDDIVLGGAHVWCMVGVRRGE